VAVVVLVVVAAVAVEEGIPAAMVDLRLVGPTWTFPTARLTRLPASVVLIN